MGQASEWRIAVKGEQRGPYTLDQLRALIAEGRLPADTLVWRPGMANWASMGSVPELTAPLSRGPVPGAAPVAAAGPIGAAFGGMPSAPAPGPSAWSEFLAFRRMLTPTLIKILFWLGIAGCGLMGLFQLFGAFRFGSAELFFTALVTLVVGPLLVRVYCELTILFFRIYDTLQEIKEQRK
jgi:hypothetical protein